jgi:hypothetical protein
MGTRGLVIAEQATSVYRDEQIQKKKEEQEKAASTQEAAPAPAESAPEAPATH